MSETQSTIQAAVIAFVAEITGTPHGELGPSSSVETVEAWDSVAHINLILSIEAEYGVTINPEQAIDLTSVSALEEFITRETG